MNRLVHVIVGGAVDVRRRSERGLSQSTENAILLAAALIIAGGIVVAVTAFVNREMAGFGG